MSQIKEAENTENRFHLAERAKQLESGFDMETAISMMDSLVLEEGNPGMKKEWESDIAPEVEGSRSYHRRYAEGLRQADLISKSIEEGARFSWWDYEGYRTKMNSTREVISDGQFVNVLGAYALNMWTGRGPVVEANHIEFFNDSPVFINALTNATVTNMGDGFPAHMVAVESANKLTGGTKCPAYTPGPFMETVGRELIDLSPTPEKGAKIAFFNSGGDSVGVAISAAEIYAQKKGYDTRKKAIYFKEAYHGNIEGKAAHVTSGINATLNGGKMSIELEFPNMPQEIEPVFEELRANIVDKNIVSAIVMEAIQGDGGGVEMHPVFFNEMMKLAIDNDIPVIVDEVQSGFGRTGTTWAVDTLIGHWKNSDYVKNGGYPEKPPLMTAIAKSMTNGAVPGSAVIIPEKYAVLGRAQGLNTYSGHPTTLAAAHVTAELMKDPVLPYMVERNRSAFLNGLGENVGNDRIIKSVRGRGLMIFLEIDNRDPEVPGNSLMQAQLIGEKRIFTGTVARGGLRVHLPINAPSGVWQTVGGSISELAQRLEYGEEFVVAKEILMRGGPSGLSSRTN